MGLKPLRVLSIDWDYFIDASIEDKYTMFPDGGNEDIGEKLITYIWACRYGMYPIRESVKVDEPHLLQIKRILSHQLWDNVKVMVADSHKWAYTFIKHSIFYTFYPDQQIEVYNVDFHHDMYDLCTDTLDCGNWLRLLKQDCNVKPYWIAREDSELDGVTVERISMDDLEQMEMHYDLIFFCHSGVWSPPHLDKYFLEMVKPYKNQNYTACPEPNVYINRDTAAFKSCVDNHTFVLDSVISQLHLEEKHGTV